MHRAITALAVFLLLATAAEARPRAPTVAHDDCGISMPCEGVRPSARGQEIARQMRFGRARNVYSGSVVGSRPAGCPRRYCGCALSIRKFGKQVSGLNLAANWRRFPRAAPAGGKVAVRSGHVFELLEHVEGSVWKVWDPNSGGGKTRVHHRSIAGYAVVDPAGVRVAGVE